MKIITLFLTLALLPFAYAQDWRHIRATATDGTQISIDYVLNVNMDDSMKPVHTITAWPVYINIRGSNAKLGSKISVVMPHQIGETKMLYQPNLMGYTDHFSGNLADSKREFLNGTAPFDDVTAKVWGYYYNGNLESQTEIAISIDGNWLDFEGQGHNFKFNFLNGDTN